jgi:hypothetical protein
MFDGVAAYLKLHFGELAAIKFGLWISIVLAFAAIYGFFFNETAGTYQSYYEYKLEKCADAALTAARIANSNYDDGLPQALARFDELYYGQLILFESRELAGQMVRFRALFAERDGDLDLAKVRERKKAISADVRQAALQLAAQCRREVRPTLLDVIYDRIFPVRQ